MGTRASRVVAPSRYRQTTIITAPPSGESDASNEGAPTKVQLFTAEAEESSPPEQDVVFFNDRNLMTRNTTHSWDTKKGWRVTKSNNLYGASLIFICQSVAIYVR